MRGHKSIFKDIFYKVEKGNKMSNSRLLMPLRNNLLLHRYYFFIEIARMRFDDALKQLEREFFISEIRLIAIISSHSEKLKNIVASQPTKKALEKAYPHIKWDC